jgi:hypothetical protein
METGAEKHRVELVCNKNADESNANLKRKVKEKKNSVNVNIYL